MVAPPLPMSILLETELPCAILSVVPPLRYNLPVPLTEPAPDRSVKPPVEERVMSALIVILLAAHNVSVPVPPALIALLTVIFPACDAPVLPVKTVTLLFAKAFVNVVTLITALSAVAV